MGKVTLRKIKYWVLFALCAAFLCCATFVCTQFFAEETAFAEETVARAGDGIEYGGINNTTVIVTAETGTAEEKAQLMTTGWGRALDMSNSRTTITFQLNSDWVAVDGRFSGVPFNTSTGADNNTYSSGGNISIDETGAIHIPAGKRIILDLNGHKIDRQLLKATMKSTTAVVQNYGTLTIKDSSATNANGTNGTGEICGGWNANWATGGGGTNLGRAGGGVYSDGPLTLESGSVCDNISAYGGGIFIDSHGTFLMTGGSIAGNFASVTILVSDENGTVEVPESAMKDPLGNANGHLITGTKVKLGYADYYDTETGKPLFEQCVEVNRSDECGGGLYSRGYMEIRGGIFDNNRAQYGAAFDIRTFSSENFANAYVQSKVLGGEFKNCISLMQGSMCHIFGAILFDEYNGNGGAWIHHNSASVVGSGSGGAIYVRKNNSYAGDFTVTINKILIEENESKVWAGGISDDGNSTVTLNGGTIRNNRTTEPTLINKTEYYGGGIFVNSYAELKMSGNVNIYGNTMVVNGRSTDPTMELEEVASDINLNKGAKVYVGAFTPSTTQKIKIFRTSP